MNAFTTGNPTSRATAALPSDGPKINHNREETVVRLVTLPVWCPGGHTDDVGLAAVAQLDVPVGEVVQPGQLSPRELLTVEEKKKIS